MSTYQRCDRCKRSNEDDPPPKRSRFGRLPRGRDVVHAFAFHNVYGAALEVPGYDLCPECRDATQSAVAEFIRDGIPDDPSDDPERQ